MNEYILEAGRKMGRPTDIVQQYKSLMIEAGLVNVTEKVFKWPSNTWPKDPKYKELGAWNLINFDEGLEAMTMALFTRVLGWSMADYTVFAARIRNDMRNRKMHTYWAM